MCKKIENNISEWGESYYNHYNTTQEYKNTIMPDQRIQFVFICEGPHERWLTSYTEGPLPTTYRNKVVFILIHTDKPTANIQLKSATYKNVYILDHNRKIYNKCEQMSTIIRHLIIWNDANWQYFVINPDGTEFIMIDAVNTPCNESFIHEFVPYCLMVVNNLKAPTLQRNDDLTVEQFIPKALAKIHTNSSSETTCYADGCYNTTGLRHCGACKISKYCSKICQRLDWKNHKELCSNFTRLQAIKKKEKESL